MTEPSTFEWMLADPDEQFDLRSELLASIEACTNAVPAAASGRSLTAEDVRTAMATVADHPFQSPIRYWYPGMVRNDTPSAGD